MEIIDLLRYAQDRSASDLHLIAGLSPVLRVSGEIITADIEPLTPEQTSDLILSCIPPEKRKSLDRDMQLCYSLKIPDAGYFRIAVYYEQGTLGASVRIGASSIKTPEELGLPASVPELVRRTAGLILVTGPTGSGKTTTLNSMIDMINRERRCKIITVEDPIEYVHSNKRSIVVQQEVHTDTKSFSSALVHILRQDPDVIAVGEMRDLETISMALTAAETGHLVISTLHTPDAPQTIDRIVDVFHAAQQNQVRMQLANSLEGIVSQQLVPKMGADGRVLASEVMLATPAVRNIVREGKPSQLYNVMATGVASGMRTMDLCLRELYQQGIIGYDAALSRARFPDEIRSSNRTGVG